MDSVIFSCMRPTYKGERERDASLIQQKTLHADAGFKI